CAGRESTPGQGRRCASPARDAGARRLGGRAGPASGSRRALGTARARMAETDRGVDASRVRGVFEYHRRMVPVVAILGGGAYAARLIEVIAGSAIAPCEIRIHARDRDRLCAIAAYAAAQLAAAGSEHRVRACAERGDALEGAHAVVLLIRVGGLAARAYDESFPA